jgi:hypothetical protein
MMVWMIFLIKKKCILIHTQAKNYNILGILAENSYQIALTLTISQDNRHWQAILQPYQVHINIILE